MTAAQAASVGQLGGLRGCLSQLELDGRRIGLPEVLETNSIQAGCLWQYPCEYILLRIQSLARLWKTASSTKFRHNVAKNVFVLHFNLSRVFRTGWLLICNYWGEGVKKLTPSIFDPPTPLKLDIVYARSPCIFSLKCILHFRNDFASYLVPSQSESGLCFCLLA